MLRLIKVLKPLAPIMMITISFGILGFLAATAITSFGYGCRSRYIRI